MLFNEEIETKTSIEQVSLLKVVRTAIIVVMIFWW